MAIIKWKEGETDFALAVGILFNLKAGTSQNGKKYASFSISYAYSRNEFDNPTNLYISCIAWNDLAEYMESFVGDSKKPRFLVCGTLEKNEYRSETREQIRCEFIAVQQEIEIPKEKPTAKKADDGDWGESETEFSD